MRKIALVLGICGVFTAVGYTVCAETSDSDKELGEIAELKKQMSEENRCERDGNIINIMERERFYQGSGDGYYEDPWQI